MEKLTIIKVGGKIVEEEDSLSQLLDDFTKIEGNKLLVHGGGRSATKLADKLGIETKMVNGRRITDKETLDITVMVYGGLVNKKIVAKLQQRNINALGVTGADMDLIRSAKRPVKDVDYGYVGDVKKVNGQKLAMLIQQEIVPIVAPLSHDGMGNMLNTNADTIAGETAKALANFFDVKLIFCFEMKGVMEDINREESVIKKIDKTTFENLVKEGIVKDGMIPKLENAFDCINSGVKEVIITQSTDIKGEFGTTIS